MAKVQIARVRSLNQTDSDSAINENLDISNSYCRCCFHIFTSKCNKNAANNDFVVFARDICKTRIKFKKRLSWKICDKCKDTVNNFWKFKSEFDEKQAMFSELVDNGFSQDINKIRTISSETSEEDMEEDTLEQEMVLIKEEPLDRQELNSNFINTKPDQLQELIKQTLKDKTVIKEIIKSIDKKIDKVLVDFISAVDQIHNGAQKDDIPIVLQPTVDARLEFEMPCKSTAEFDLFCQRLQDQEFFDYQATRIFPNRRGSKSMAIYCRALVAKLTVPAAREAHRYSGYKGKGSNITICRKFDEIFLRFMEAVVNAYHNNVNLAEFRSLWTNAWSRMCTEQLKKRNNKYGELKHDEELLEEVPSKKRKILKNPRNAKNRLNH